MDIEVLKISDGYRESISKGIAAIQYFKGRVNYGTGDREEQLQRLKNEIRSCDAILIGPVQASPHLQDYHTQVKDLISISLILERLSV